MIRDTAAQDRPIPQPSPWRRRAPLLLGAAMLAAVFGALWPTLQRALSAHASVSAARLVVATVAVADGHRSIASLKLAAPSE